MKKIILYIAILVLVSCRTVYVDKPIYTTLYDTVKITEQKIDSVYIKDSTSFIVKDDTVFIYKEKTKYKYKYINDTIYETKIDSVAYPVEKIVEKEVSYTPFWIKILGIIGAISLGFIIWKIYKLFKKI